jgi:hypothetical protein
MKNVSGTTVRIKHDDNGGIAFERIALASPRVALKAVAWFLSGALVCACFSVDSSAHDKGFRAAASGMALFNSSQQGGQGPSGSTLLTHADLVYSGKFWSVGAFGQFDKQGGSETDTAIGPKIELHYNVFYLEGGWAPFMHRAFTDRSIALQTGSAWLMGVGVRVSLGGGKAPVPKGGSGPRGMFLQFSYKYRVQLIDKQDSVVLSDPIIQRDGYPLFGIGYKF